MKKRGNTDNVTSSYTDGEGQIYAILLVSPLLNFKHKYEKNRNSRNVCFSKNPFNKSSFNLT